MKKPFKYVLVLLIAAALSGKSAADTGFDFQKMIQPLPVTARFEQKDYYVWCGSLIRDKSGVYHLFYSRWPKRYGHNAWASHSEVAHAISDSPFGPFRHKDLALPAREHEFWDGQCTHNPTVQYFEGKYYLYYMGNSGDRVVSGSLNWTHRNHQRIGAAVATSLDGPWKRFEKPLIDISPEQDAPDALVVTNPTITRGPNGNYLLIYKAVGKKRPLPKGGPVVHLAALSKSPTGPFVKQQRLLFTASGIDFPAEDPFIWYQADQKKYYAILKDMNGSFTHAGRSLVLFSSNDGSEWELAAHPLVSTLRIALVDGRTETLEHLERPQLLFENGQPAVLLCAADEDAARSHSFNLQIPLRRKR